MVATLSRIQTRLKLRHLQLLIALSENRSLGMAAEAIGITQPAASKSLRELEDLLNMQLFSRDGHRVAITPQGEAVTAYAKMVFDRMADLREELASIERADLGRVRIGAVSATAPELISDVIVRLRESHPRLNLLVLVDTSDMLMLALEDEKLDLVVGMIPSGWEPKHLAFEPLSEEGLSIVVRPDHPATRMTTPSLAGLAGLPWIMHPYTSPMRQLIHDAFLRAREALPENIIETTSNLTSVAVVMRTDIVAVMSTPVARFFADRGALAILPIELQRRWAPYGLIMQKDKRITPALAITIDAIRASSVALQKPDEPGELLR